MSKDHIHNNIQEVNEYKVGSLQNIDTVRIGNMEVNR